MQFRESLRVLGIEDYAERIWNSNSHGELSHTWDYIDMARAYNGHAKWFRPLFLEAVAFAQREWTRPESVFQHMPAMIKQICEVISSQVK